MDSLTIGRDGPRVGLRDTAIGRGLTMEWDAALLFGQLVQHKARAGRPPEAERAGPVVVRVDDAQVVIVDLAGQLLFVWPLRAAIEIGNALIAKAHEAESEEAAIAEAIAMDHALLQRLGINLGLTRDAWLARYAGNLAAWDSRLRRAIPSSGRLRQYHVGTPEVAKVGALWSVTTSPPMPSPVSRT